MRSHAVIISTLCAALLSPLARSQTLQADHIEAACPGVATWNRAHADANAPTSAAPATPTRPKLEKQLLDMAAADQKAREDYIKAGMKPGPEFEHGQSVDAHNLQAIKAMFGNGYFPDEREVGEDGLHAGFILVQHADHDPALQASLLPRLKDLYRKKEIPGEAVAMLADRVAVHQGKPQPYGTQVAPGKDGNLEFSPIDHPETLDTRRASMGLMPFSDYKCEVGASYGKPVT